MAFDIIKKDIAKTYSTEQLLGLLPSHESMNWVNLPGATPPTALVLGTNDGYNILAFLVKLDKNPREIRYCSKPVNNAVQSPYVRSLSQDEVVQSSLDAPFKYIADVSKVGKRNFSNVVKWYFLSRGIYDGFLHGDDISFSERLQVALRRIDAKQQSEKAVKARDRPDSARHTPTIPEDSSELENPRSGYSLRSSERSHDKLETDAQQTTTKQPVGASENEDRDLPMLRKYLDSHKALYLLQNIPEADEVQFVAQNIRPDARPKKLFVGHHSRNNKEIYAYMRKAKAHHHEINFYAEGVTDLTPLSTEEVTKQRILHPFNKTYPKSAIVDQSDRARFTLVVKWYFIAAGVVKNAVIKETKAYPERLRSALTYIAQRMGSAAVEPPDSATQTIQDTDNEDSDSTSSRLETSDTQPTLTSATPLGTPSKASDSTPLPPSSEPEPWRATKRSAEDAEFEDFARILSQDQEISQQINDVEQELEMLEIQRQVFLENWQEKQAEVMKKRDELDAKRGDVRQRFKRRSLAFAGQKDA